MWGLQCETWYKATILRSWAKLRAWAVWFAALLVIGFIALPVLEATPAYAAGRGDSYCPHGGNYTSAACLYGVTQHGDYTEFHNNTMYFIGNQGNYLETLGFHINHTIWAYSGACPQDNTWIELGDTQGGGPGSYDQPGYYYYWAYTTNFPSNYSGFIIGNSDNTGDNHAYELLYVGNATYQAWYTNSQNNFVMAAQVGGMGWGTCTGQAGEELSGNDGACSGSNYYYNPCDWLYVMHSDVFGNNPLEWQDTSSVWHAGWNASMYWQDHPCNLMGYSTPDCLDFSWYNGSVNDLWTDKP